MKRNLTSFSLKRLMYKGLACAGIALAGTSAIAQTTYVPMTFTAGKGFKYDVVVEDTVRTVLLQTAKVWADTTFGTTGPAANLGINDWYLLGPNYYAQGAGLQVPINGALPANGNIVSAQFGVPQLNYQLAPYNADNSLRLQTNPLFDTLKFVNTTLTGDVFILGAAADGTDYSTATANATVTLLFANGTTQVASLVFPNYTDSTGAGPAREGIGRVNGAVGGAQSGRVNRWPRLYDRRIALAPANYGTTLTGVRIQKTSGTVLNIMGVTVANNNCLPVATINAPTGLTITTATISWAAVTGSAGYDWVLASYPTLPATLPLAPPTSAPGVIVTSGSTTAAVTSTSFSTLVPGTNYVFFVRSKCSSGSSESIWNSRGVTTPVCATPVFNAAVPATTRSLTFSWRKVGTSGVQTVNSPLHHHFEYALSTNGTTAPTTGWTTPAPPNDTFVTFNNLLVCRQYYLWLRNYCTATEYTQAAAKGGVTLCCPTPGVVNNSINTPGTARFGWPGSADAAVAGYLYSLQIGTATPVPSPGPQWIATPDTFVVFNNLNPGQQYTLFVRSNCTDTVTVTPQTRTIINPFYSCDTTGRPRITNVNLHGAQIDWNAGYTPSPEPIKWYNIAVTTSPTPPANTLVGDPTLPAHNPPANRYFRIKDTFFHPTTLNLPPLTGGVLYYVHVRAECDTVYRPPYATPPVFTSNWGPWKTDTFRTPVTCIEPITPVISNVTSHTAQMDWNLYWGIQGYEYYIDEFATPPTGGTLISFNSLNALNLNSNTDYWFHLRTKCDNVPNFSPWTNTPFHTPALCNLAPPNPSLTTIASTSAVFNWATVPNATRYDCAVTTSSTPPVFPDATVTIGTYTATGLTPNTDYYFHLQAKCSPNDSTGWTSIPFKTDWPTSASTIHNGVSVLVYPNPVNDEVTVDIQNNPRGTLQVIDLTGKVLYSTETRNQKTTISMKPYAAGMYMIKYFVNNTNMQMIRVQKL
ncbi:MAG TPA: T9SS type A sorting domain-containing protein [Flavipsychrobacter sp.]|nr:T9SS type A sorting domain-containing protein [Flavipsychrobacter sp.]